MVTLVYLILLYLIHMFLEASDSFLYESFIHSYQRSFERNVVTDTKRITFRVTKHAPSGRKSVPHFCKGFLWFIYTYVQGYALSQFVFLQSHL